MNHFFLKKTGNKEILYEGKFLTLSQCLEQALQENVCLDYVDLRGANLTNANLDDGSFNYARFDCANLTGANLSATNLNRASFKEAALYNACFCEAILSESQFFGASFGSTDIAWANMRGACFDTLSAFELKFSETLLMQDAKFYDRTGTICNMSHAPVVIQGLQYPVILFDDYMKVGSAVFPFCSWIELLQKRELNGLGADIAAFIKTYGSFLFTLAKVRSRDWHVQEIGLQKNVA